MIEKWIMMIHSFQFACMSEMSDQSGIIKEHVLQTTHFLFNLSNIFVSEFFILTLTKNARTDHQSSSWEDL